MSDPTRNELVDAVNRLSIVLLVMILPILALVDVGWKVFRAWKRTK